MDPNDNLRTQLALAKSILDSQVIDDKAEAAEQLAELVIVLNGWIVDGGFLPRTWESSR